MPESAGGSPPARRLAPGAGVQMTVAEAVRDAVARLAGVAVADPRGDAERLMAWLLETDRGGVVARRPEELTEQALTRYRELIVRRERREPLQHLTGIQEFYGLELAVDRRAMIPRPETEGLVDVVLAAGLRHGATVLDLGTGSGCIAIALAATRSDLVIRAVDRSVDALDLARENAVRHRVDDRVAFLHADLSALPSAWRGQVDAVASNPPYVPEQEWRGLQAEVRDHEPREALVPGPTGLEAYEAIAAAAVDMLRADGLLALEIGFSQADAVVRILGAAGFDRIKARPDLRGIPRVVSARRSRAAQAPAP